MKPLTRNDILALKQADHVIFQSVYMEGRSNIAVITCAKQNLTDSDEFKTWEVKVASNIQFLDDSIAESNCMCSYLIHNSFVDWVWQTAVGTLLPEDELELLWMPDAESSYELIQTGFHCDLLRMIIYRQKYRFHYIIGVLVSNKNKVRMISGLSKQPTKKMLSLG
jgi:hypothetical protein